MLTFAVSVNLECDESTISYEYVVTYSSGYLPTISRHFLFPSSPGVYSIPPGTIWTEPISGSSIILLTFMVSPSSGSESLSNTGVVIGVFSSVESVSSTAFGLRLIQSIVTVTIAVSVNLSPWSVISYSNVSVNDFA